MFNLNKYHSLNTLYYSLSINCGSCPCLSQSTLVKYVKLGLPIKPQKSELHECWWFGSDWCELLVVFWGGGKHGVFHVGSMYLILHCDKLCPKCSLKSLCGTLALNFTQWVTFESRHLHWIYTKVTEGLSTSACYIFFFYFLPPQNHTLLCVNLSQKSQVNT